MNKLEQAMVKAAFDFTPWKQGNTEVTIGTEVTDSGDSISVAEVRLHGHLIATARESVNGEDCRVIPNLCVFYHWPTRTTRSRLCALGVNAAIKNFAPTIDGKQITAFGTEGYQLV